MNQTDPTAALRDRLIAAIKASPFEGLRAVDHSPNGPLQITVKVDDLADTLLRLAVLPEPTGRAAVLREAADIAESQRRFERVTAARWSAQVSENVGILRVADHLRRLAVEADGNRGDEVDPVVTVHAAPALSPAAEEALGALVDVAKQQMSEARPSWCRIGGFDQHDDYRDDVPAPTAADSEETRTLLRCNWAHTLHEHTPHDWAPQPGMDPLHCPGYPDAASPPV